MTLSLLVPPEAEPVSLDDAKTHLRVEHVLDDDAITLHVQAAREHVEGVTARALLEQRWELTLPCWPSCGALSLPRPPLLGVVEVRYLDPAGVEQVWPVDQYVVDAPAGPRAGRGSLRPVSGVWPALASDPRAVRVTFRAGYEADHLPASLRSAVLLATGDLYHRREIGPAVSRLLAPFAVDLGA